MGRITRNVAPKIGQPNAFLPVEAPVGKESITPAREGRQKIHPLVKNALMTMTDGGLVHVILLHAIIDQKDVLLLHNIPDHAKVGLTMRTLKG